MKKSLLALAALTAFAGVASAQSSVTLFGVVDLELRDIKNTGGSEKSLSTDGINSSRLGVRGVEDLGGGLRAGFWIEGGLAADQGAQGGSNGIAAVNWNRRSTVSLMGGFGELRLGRDYTPSFWNTTVFDPFGTNGVGSAINASSTLGSGAITFVRDNNTVGYFLPPMGGLYGQVMIAAGEAVQGQKYMGGRIGYAGGPVNVAGSMGKTAKTFAMVDDYTHTNLSGSFMVGPANLMAQYDKAKYSKEDMKRVMLGATVTMGPGLLKASFNKTSGSTANAVLTNQYGAKQMAIGYEYNLSKRTAVYGTYSSLNNDGTATNGAAFAVGGPGASLTRGDTSSGFDIGLRHTF